LIIFFRKMDYEQFFQTQECNCYNSVRTVVVILSLLTLVIDCVTVCKRNRKIEQITTENETLKTIILKSVDKAFIHMMKNGNDSEDDHED
jgi:hypothetical protein